MFLRVPLFGEEISEQFIHLFLDVTNTYQGFLVDKHCIH